MKLIVSDRFHRVPEIFTLLMLAIVFLIVSGCKKSDNNPGNSTEFTKLFPAANQGSFWRLYYDNYSIADTLIEHEIDSVFVSSDTVGLNVVDTSGATIDTVRKIFTIIKSYAFQKRFGRNDWVKVGPFNYGVFRIDPQNRVRSIRTTNNCWSSIPSIPSPEFFYETTVFDYNVKTGDSVLIEQYYKGYESKTTAIQDFQFDGYTLKKQFFYNSTFGTIKRTQFAGLFNTMPFAREVVPNYTVTPPTVLLKMVYYDTPSDSLELDPDFMFY